MPNNTQEWTAVVAMVVALAGVIGAILGGARGAFRDSRTDRQKGADAAAALSIQQDRFSLDRSAQTLDGVFKLVEQLQEEVKRRDDRLVILEAALAQALEQLERLRQEIRDLKNNRGVKE